MAAPPQMTVKDLSGKFVMNTSLSDSPDPLLALQGISWLTRKAIGLATVVLTVKQYTDDEGKVHIDITSVASGLTSTQENRTLDFTDRAHKDNIFGNVVGRSHLISLADSFEPCRAGYSEAEINFILAKTLKDGTTPTKFEGDDAVHSYVVNQDAGYGWTAEQVWGFEVVGGQRYYTRRVVGKNAAGDKTELVRLVYDYKGAADAAEKEDEDLTYGDE